MAEVAYSSLPFREQIEFFRRKLNVNTERYTDVWEAAHDHAFMVAGANRDDLVAAFRAAIDRAIAEGGTLADFRKEFDRIVAQFGWSYNGGRNWRSRVIYETNLRTSYAAGRWAQLQEGKKWRPYWEYVHSDAVEHPRPLHVAWDGLILDADDPWWQTHFPPNGWGCFLPGTMIRGQLRIGLKTRYAGPAIEIETAHGAILRVTANHPVLTSRGWLAADQIEKGDQLVHCEGGIDTALAVVVDDEQPPTRVEDAFDALAAKGLRAADMAPGDLHGDARFGEGEAHVAGSDRELRDRRQSTSLHFREDGAREPTDAAKTELAVAAARSARGHSACLDAAVSQDVIDAGLAETGQPGDLSHRQIAAVVVGQHFGLDGIVASIGGAPGGAELALDQGAIADHAFPAQGLAGAVTALVDAPHAQEPIDGLPAAPVLFRQLLSGDPALVACDRVVGVRKFEWSGHVYDFQSATHLIVAEGIVVHNCQCTVQSRAARDLKRMGKSGPDKAPTDGTHTVTVGKRGPAPFDVETPVGVDPGFGYAPGRSAFEHRLRDEAAQVLQIAAAAADGWVLVTTQTAADIARPPLVPLFPPPVPLGPLLTSAEETVGALTDLLGAATRVFDVYGLPIAMVADVLGLHIAEDLGRTRFLPLLIDLLDDPWEVWLTMERHAATRALRVRTRLIKGYELGNGKALLLVADQQRGMFVSWTLVPSRDLAYINRQRQGVLWYGAD